MGQSNAYLPSTGINIPDSSANSSVQPQSSKVDFEKVLKNLILDREPKDMKPLQKFADIDYY